MSECVSRFQVPNGKHILLVILDGILSWDSHYADLVCLLYACVLNLYTNMLTVCLRFPVGAHNHFLESV